MRRIAQYLLNVKLVRYGIAGVATNLAAYILFLILLHTGLAEWVCVATAYLCGLLAGFLAHRSWTFQSAASHKADAAKYLLVYGLGLFVNVAIYKSLAQYYEPWLAQIGNVGLTALLLFALLNVLGFGKARASS